MTEQRQNSKELSVSNKSMNDGMEVDWANIFREIISIRKTLYKAAGIARHNATTSRGQKLQWTAFMEH